MATTLEPSSGLGWSEDNNAGGSLRAGFTRINFHGNKVGAIGRTTLMKTTMERPLGLSSLGPIFMATTLEPSSGLGWSEDNNAGAVSGPEFTRTDFHGNNVGAIFGSEFIRTDVPSCSNLEALFRTYSKPRFPALEQYEHTPSLAFRRWSNVNTLRVSLPARMPSTDAWSLRP